MARSAKLTSIDAVREMTAALIIFGEEVAGALDELDINVRRAVDWIEQDRKNFWNHEVQRGWEKVSEARVELEKARTYRKMADQPRDCRQEQILLDRAKRRAQTAEEKKRAMPQWSHRVKHSVQELNGVQTQLASWLRAEFPKAVAALEQMSAMLERYASVQGGIKQQQASSTVQRIETEQEDDVDRKEEEQEEEV